MAFWILLIDGLLAQNPFTWILDQQFLDKNGKKKTQLRRDQISYIVSLESLEMDQARRFSALL